MSTPTSPYSGLPRFFLDRNLGRIAVPRGLRAAGVEVVSLAERYGVPEDETIIERACRRPGPFVYRLHPNAIELRRIWA